MPLEGRPISLKSTLAYRTLNTSHAMGILRRFACGTEATINQPIFRLTQIAGADRGYKTIEKWYSVPTDPMIIFKASL